MTGVGINFISNSIPKGSPEVHIGVGYSFTNGKLGKKIDPRVDICVSQLTRSKHYNIHATPEEARELAKKLIEQADAVDKECA